METAWGRRCNTPRSRAKTDRTRTPKPIHAHVVPTLSPILRDRSGPAQVQRGRPHPAPLFFHCWPVDASPMARVLVVDDDPALLEVLSLALGEAGHEVLTAHDGVLGLQA